MALERTSGGASLIDVLDRVLDKGIVIDAWVRVSLVGIDLVAAAARVVVASVDIFCDDTEVGAASPVTPRTGHEALSNAALVAENAALRARLAALGAPTSASASAEAARRRRTRVSGV